MSSSLGHKENAMWWRTKARDLKVKTQESKKNGDISEAEARKRFNHAKRMEMHAQFLEDNSKLLVIENKTNTEELDEQEALRELDHLEKEESLKNTLKNGRRLRYTARKMRDDLRTSEEESRRLATLTGINPDENSDENPVTCVRPPVEPRPPASQKTKLKLWLKKIGQAINCSGPQGGKKTRKHRKYRNKSRKHKKFKKSKKHKKKNKKHTKKN